MASSKRWRKPCFDKNEVTETDGLGMIAQNVPWPSSRYNFNQFGTKVQDLPWDTIDNSTLEHPWKAMPGQLRLQHLT